MTEDNNDINPATGKPRKRHSPQTILKMSEKRRARTVQPRTGTSKKAYNLYLQLKKDYKDDKNSETILKWIEENRMLLSDTADETKQMGIMCDFHLQYPGIYEVKTGSILYGDKVEETFDNSNDPYELIDEAMDEEING